MPTAPLWRRWWPVLPWAVRIWCSLRWEPAWAAASSPVEKFSPVCGAAPGKRGICCWCWTVSPAPAAAGVVARYAVYVAAGLTDFVNILAPEMILLGGGISRQGEALLAPIREYVATHCFGQREGAIPTIAAAKLGNEAGIIGAAAL